MTVTCMGASDVAVTVYLREYDAALHAVYIDFGNRGGLQSFCLNAPLGAMTSISPGPARLLLCSSRRGALNLERLSRFLEVGFWRNTA